MKTINVLLWIVQVLLAGMFVMAGAMKTFQPIAEIMKSIPYGVAELLGGLGLIISALLKIKPKLTVLAAYGLTLVMVLAAIFHIFRGEFQAIGMTIIIGLLAYFVAWGRNKKVVILK